jgi:hypothetical protein
VPKKGFVTTHFAGKCCRRGGSGLARQLACGTAAQDGVAQPLGYEFRYARVVGPGIKIEALSGPSSVDVQSGLCCISLLAHIFIYKTSRSSLKEGEFGQATQCVCLSLLFLAFV